MERYSKPIFVVVMLTLAPLAGCQRLVVDSGALFKPSVEMSEIVGFLAGLGTTFAACLHEARGAKEAQIPSPWHMGSLPSSPSRERPGPGEVARDPDFRLLVGPSLP